MSANGQFRVSEFDLLTEVLQTCPLPIRFAGRLGLTASWGVDLPRGFAAICCVVRGASYLVVGEDEGPALAQKGDVFVLSPAVRHRLEQTPGSTLMPVQRLLGSLRSEDCTISLPGGEGSFSTLIGGLLEFNDAGFCPLQWVLPPLIHLQRHEIEGAGMFERIIQLFEQELSISKPGQRAILNRLIEILFIRTLQVGLVEADLACRDAVNCLLHPDLITTLVLIHREPEKPWTVSALAERAAMSRSSFSATFLKVLGKPPLQYLRDHRMQLACRLLRNPALGLKEIASRVGYDSTSAFSTAFKRLTGMHPSGYRRRETQHQSP